MREKLQYTNPQFQKLTGYNDRELQDRDFLSLIAVEDSDVFKSCIAFTLEENCPYPCEDSSATCRIRKKFS